jgi:hypothetical protein
MKPIHAIFGPRFGVLLIAALAVAGCSTAAQRQAQQSVMIEKDAGVSFKACIKSVRERPEYAPLAAHVLNLGPRPNSFIAKSTGC